jgi:hypothetical protein
VERLGHSTPTQSSRSRNQNNRNAQPTKRGKKKMQYPNQLPEPEFDDTKLWPIVAWLFREFVRDVRAEFNRDVRSLLKGVR